MRVLVDASDTVPSMQPLVVTASTAISAVGRGATAHREAMRARVSGLRPNDFDPSAGGWIGRVSGVETHSLPLAMAAFDCRNNRLVDMALHTDGFAGSVAEARAVYGPGRIAVVLGTSTSGIAAAEDAFAQRDPATGALPAGFRHDLTHDLFSLARYVRTTLGLRGPALVVSTACASSAHSFIDAAQLIHSGVCDAAVVGGADSLCRMTLHGFAALELISPGPCRPCDVGRVGISIGEAAGFALLERLDAPTRDRLSAAQPAGARPENDRLALLGMGVASDAHHMSSPHPQGAGAVSAMRRALQSARLVPAQVDWVNLHGTGTLANDAMEDLAVFEVFGNTVPCSSVKGWTGHTLGACGILEAVMVGQCMTAGFLAGCLGIEAADPAFQADVVTANRERPARVVVSNSFGFGGINCSLVLGRVP
jgi:3-oxoacyl-[acyl-carrier-protein] synthase-1